MKTRRNSAVGRVPADLDQRLERGVELDLLGRGGGESAGVAAVEGQPGEALGVACCVLDGHRPALRHGEQRETLQPRVVRDGLQVTEPGLEAVVGDAAVRQPVAAFVEPDHGGDPPELDQPVPPDRALPVELQVAQPARVDQQRRSGAVDGVGDAHPVGRAGEADVLHRVGPHHLPIVGPRIRPGQPAPDPGAAARARPQRSKRAPSGLGPER